MCEGRSTPHIERRPYSGLERQERSDQRDASFRVLERGTGATRNRSSENALKGKSFAPGGLVALVGGEGSQSGRKYHEELPEGLRQLSWVHGISGGAEVKGEGERPVLTLLF